MRLALGATPRAASRLILRRGLLLMTAGALVGLLGGLGLGRLMSEMLYSVEGFDPATFVIVPALLCSIALAACAVPAWRAASIEPLIALRSE